MSKKLETNFQPKFTRNDRFAQMSHQEKLIEQKKREILAKFEAKEKAVKADVSKTKIDTPKPTSKSATASISKDLNNVFSNDGSFLDQFKQMKETKKTETKLKSFNKPKDLDKSFTDERNKSNRWVSRRRSPSPKERVQKRVSRFSAEKVPNFEQKITINTSFSSSITQSLENQPVLVIPQNVTGQPLMKNLIPETLNYTNMTQQDIPTQSLATASIVQHRIQPPVNISQTETVITAPPVLLNVPPPQIVQGQINNTLVLNPVQPAQNMIVSTALQPILTTVNLPPPLITTNVAPVPPPCLPTVELSSIPPPHPIQVHNIPQPEPINALNIPQPAPIQVQNIPTPNSIQLNEIPNPKPLDLMAIPTPNEEKGISDHDFIKNIPPPNKSIPPPQMHESQLQTITIPATQNMLVSPSTQIQTIQSLHTTGSNSILQTQPGFSSVTVALVSTAPTLPNSIPSLMAQPILPPPGMGMNCPPILQSAGALQVTMSSFISPPPPLINQIPALNVPPPSGMQMIGAPLPLYNDMNTVFPPGSSEHEAMASLARMVAECGRGIEDMVMKRKNRDSNLWFLFVKESAAYRQYCAMIDEFERENKFRRETEDAKPKLEDIYEPEQVLEDVEQLVMVKDEVKQESQDDDILENNEKRRKRKSRWGDKDPNVARPIVVYNQPTINSSVLPIVSFSNQQTQPMLSKVTRSDTGLLHYATNAYGTTDLTEEEWKKAEDNYKVHLLYQDMVRKREEVERLKLAGMNKYEYDSDEDTDGGTWEHKAREKEMTATKLWAQELTRQAEGKHHIGDFLPPEEFKRFLEKSSAVKEGRQPNFSDYKEFKIKEDNIGFKMLQKLGWTQGEGLGSGGTGIVEPVNKAAPRDHTQGLGLNQLDEDEDEYESYRKRMMLAYRFRPNPLNNPRRPYY